MPWRPDDRTLAWLGVAFIVSALLSLAITLGLIAAGEPPSRAAGATALGEARRLLEPSHVDSIRPMIAAYDKKTAMPGSDLYAVFFVERIKFQYPPSSLLVFDWFPRAMTGLTDGRVNEDLLRWWARLSRAAVGLTALASAAILEVGVRRQIGAGSPRLSHMAARMGLALALGAMFYPVTKAHSLGQIQVFLNALIALGVLAFLLGRRGLAGGCLGLCCLVKPQYGLVLLWALARRQWRFALVMAGVVVVGMTISVARFGLADHLRYLDVVRELSSLGEAYWPNQSVNGVLNRLLETGNPVQFSRTEFPRYNPTVYALTVLTSVAMLVVALWPGRGGRRADGALPDFGAALVAITMASPIVWEHHYGAFLPIFAAALPAAIVGRPLGRATGPWLAFSYAAVANIMLRPSLFFSNRWLGVVGSHLFFGSLLFLVLLLRLRSSSSDEQFGAPRPVQGRAPA